MKLKTLALLAGVMLASFSVNAVTRVGLLEQDADIILNISSISKIGEALKKTSFGNLWNDPEFKKAIGEYDLGKTIKEGMLSNMSEEESHLYLEEIKMLKGNIAFSIQTADKDFSLAAALSEKDFKLSLDMDRRLTELDSENKMTIHMERYQGTPIYTHIYENNESANSWQAYIDNTMLMSSSEDWVKKSIAAIKKSPVTEDKNGTPSAYLDVNMKSMIDSMIKSYEENMASMQSAGVAAPQFSPDKIVDAIGFADLNKITISVKFYDDRIVTDSTTAIKKPLKGILAVSDLSPSSLDLQLPYAPKSIISYGVSRLNLMALWRNIPQIISQATPEEAAAIFNSQLSGLSAMLGADPGRDLFANLDTQIASILVNSSPEPEGMYFIRIKNEAALQSSLQKMFDENGMLRMILGENFKLESFRDADIYEFTSDSTNKTYAITAESGYLAIGSGKIVRRYLRAVDSGNPDNCAFYKSRLFADLRKNTPSKACSYSAMDTGKYVKVFLSMIVDNPALKSEIANNTGNDNNPFPNFDINKLPSAEYMSKFFGSSFQYTVPTASGIKSHSTIYFGKNK